MTQHIRELAPSGIENVTRRGLLKGLLATSGLVLAVAILPPRAARADAPKWGADGMPHGTVNDPQRVRVDRGGRNRHHRLPSLRNGPGRAHRHAVDRRRRT